MWTLCETHVGSAYVQHKHILHIWRLCRNTFILHMWLICVVNCVQVCLGRMKAGWRRRDHSVSMTSMKTSSREKRRFPALLCFKVLNCYYKLHWEHYFFVNILKTIGQVSFWILKKIRKRIWLKHIRLIYNNSRDFAVLFK